MNNIVFIIFYFGQFPNYFPAFLDSCRRNPLITWKIYTNNEKTGTWPANVEHIYLTFESCRELFQKKFMFPIQLSTPKKLCDYKPAYGYILEDEIRCYRFWGHCDLDMIFGNIQEALKQDCLEQYDKLYSLGHFTLYRNTKAVNRCFMNPINGKVRYQEVFSNPEMIGFDEWGEGNINDIFEKSEFRFLNDAMGADIWPGRTNFTLSWYCRQKNRYIFDRKKRAVLWVDHGRVYLCWKDKRGIQKVEYPYVHMQKRMFRIPIDMSDWSEYYILPEGFYKVSSMTLEEALKKGSRWHFCDRQYIRVKLWNLRRRFRTKNFKF